MLVVIPSDLPRALKAVLPPFLDVALLPLSHLNLNLIKSLWLNSMWTFAGFLLDFANRRT